MMAAVSRLGFATRRCACPFLSQSAFQVSIASPRYFSSSKGRDPPSTFVETLSPEDRTKYESLSVEERKRFQQAAESLRRHMKSPSVEGRLSAALANALHNVEVERPVVHQERFRSAGFMALGEVDQEGTGADD